MTLNSLFFDILKTAWQSRPPLLHVWMRKWTSQKSARLWHKEKQQRMAFFFLVAMTSSSALISLKPLGEITRMEARGRHMLTESDGSLISYNKLCMLLSVFLFLKNPLSALGFLRGVNVLINTCLCITGATLLGSKT